VSQPPLRRPCARCGNLRHPAASFPEGHLCTRCLNAALAITGTCPGCGSPDRVLPGLRGGIPICRDCAGITRYFCCLHCGTETGMAGRRHRLCGRCGVRWQTARLLDDGTGTIRAQLQPLADALTTAPNPAATVLWLEEPHIQQLLTSLASGELPLTHQALDAWPRPRAVPHLRDLLVCCGVLPAADKQLLQFQTWLTHRLASLAGHPHLRLLRQFGFWHQLPRMRTRAATGPLRATALQYARSRFTQAETFLTWTADHGLRPATLTQADIDTYYATHRAHQRQAVRAFLIWATEHGHLPRHLDIPRQPPSTGQAITQQRRLALLRRFATDTTIAIRPRAAACLMLLYAQPLSRILRLTETDLSRDDGGQTWLRLGDPPSPVPAPFDALLHQLAATRHDHTPANHASPWLFPGRNPGQPADYRAMLLQLRDLGLPMRTARISALRQLVLQVPAPVVAQALGFHHTTTTRQHINAGAPWSQYAAADHTTNHPASPPRLKGPT
jgi:integrase